MYTTITKINNAIADSRRFVKLAIKWKRRLKKEGMPIVGTKEGGSAKRASLDLTRSLAELRKP